MRRHYIVSYDISDPVRLRKVHKVVRDYGEALQLSVFACQLHDKDRAILEAKLRAVIHHKEDQVVFVDLGRVKEGEESDCPPGTTAIGRPLELGRVRVVVV